MSSATLSTLYVMNTAQNKTRLFHCRGESYRVNRGTWALWPRARLIVYPGPTRPLRLVTRDAVFITLAVENDCAVSDELPEQAVCTECTAALVKKGICRLVYRGGASHSPDVA